MHINISEGALNEIIVRYDNLHWRFHLVRYDNLHWRFHLVYELDPGIPHSHCPFFPFVLELVETVVDPLFL